MVFVIVIRYTGQQHAKKKKNENEKQSLAV